MTPPLTNRQAASRAMWAKRRADKAAETASMFIRPHDPTVCAYCHNGLRVDECGMCRGTGKPPKPWFAPIVKASEKRMAKIIRKAVSDVAEDMRKKGFTGR